MKKFLLVVIFVSLSLTLLSCHPTSIYYPAEEMRGAKVGPAYLTFDLESGKITFSNTLNEGIRLDVYFRISNDSNGFLLRKDLGGFQDDCWSSSGGHQISKYDIVVVFSTWRGIRDSTVISLDDKSSPISNVWRWDYDRNGQEFELWFDTRDGLNVIWAFAMRQELVKIQLEDHNYDILTGFDLRCYEIKHTRLQVPIPKELRIFLWERVKVQDDHHHSHLEWQWVDRGWIKLT